MIKELNKKIEDLNKQIAADQEVINKKKLSKQEQIKQLETEKEELKLDLHKSIENKFKGIIPTININEYGVKIRITDESNREVNVLDYLYNDTSFALISRKLAYSIVDLYNKVYGEPKEYNETVDILSRWDCITSLY